MMMDDDDDGDGDDDRVRVLYLGEGYSVDCYHGDVESALITGGSELERNNCSGYSSRLYPPH